MSDIQNEQYLYELEAVLEKLLEFFQPGGSDTYLLEDINGELFEISDDMASAVDRASDVLYMESGE